MPFEGVPPRGDSPPPLPVNVIAEQNLLGAILVNNAAYAAAADIVRPEHFGTPVHGRIFEACGKLIERGIPANAVTLKNRFDQDGALEAIGGAHYLARLAIDAVTIINAPHYAAAIRDCWRRRAIIDIAAVLDTRARLADIDDPPEAMIEGAGSALDALLSASGEAGHAEAPEGLRPAAEAAKAALGRSEAAYKGEAQSGVMSGIDSLDRITGGFQRGDLIYIGKRPSMGGTAFCVTVALNAARAGKRVAFWSAEMNRTRIGHRMLAWLTGISTRTQRIGALAGDEWSRLIEAQRELDGLPLLIDDSAPIGASTIRRRARQAQQRGGLDLMLVDYLQLVRAGDGQQDLRAHEAIAAVSGQLRDLAKELDVPVVCLAQLTPRIDERENKRPTIADFRGCLPGSALVLDPLTGKQHAIRDLVGASAMVAALDDDWRLRPAEVGRCWSTGVQPILRIKTRTGRVLRCSHNHRVFTEKGYIRACELSESSFVGLPRVQRVSASATISQCRAVLLGWLIGDGCLMGMPALSIGVASDIPIATGLATAGFRGLNYRVRDNAHGRGICFELGFSAGRNAGAKQNTLTRWLRHLGIWGRGAGEKCVPDEMFQQPSDTVASFLRGLFHADGGLIRKGKTVQFSSISERLCRDVQHLLLRLGIVSSIKYYDRPPSGFAHNARRQWRLEIYNREHVLKFFGTVGFLGEKHRRAVALIQPHKQDSGALDRLPKAATREALHVKSLYGLTWSSLGWRDQGKAMSRSSALRLGNMHNNNVLRRFGSSDVFWDAIVSIEPDGEEDTFDLSVPGLANFCVDDFITHNSHDLEQDAGLVAMLYREEYYLQSAEPRAAQHTDPLKLDKLHAEWANALAGSRDQAEIIVVKARDDMVSTAHCAFDPVRSLFFDDGRQGRFW